MHTVLFVLFLSTVLYHVHATTVVLDPNEIDSNYPHHVIVKNFFSFYWNISDGIIYIQIAVPQQCWIAIGFHVVNSSDPNMMQADVITAIWGENYLTVDDRYSFYPGKPNTDKQIGTGGCHDDIINSTITGYQNSSISIARFARKLVTNDTACDHPIQPGLTNVIVAYGFNNSFSDGHEDATLFGIDLFTTSVTSGVTSSSTTSNDRPTSSSSGDGNQTKTSTSETIVIIVGCIVLVISLANIIAALIVMTKRRAQNNNEKITAVIATENQPLLS